MYVLHGLVVAVDKRGRSSRSGNPCSQCRCNLMAVPCSFHPGLQIFARSLLQVGCIGLTTLTLARGCRYEGAPVLVREVLHTANFSLFALQALSSRGSSVFSEVDAFELLLRYKTSNAGCCKVLHHPLWGSAVYPASLMTNAPLAAICDAIGLPCPELVTHDSK